MLACLCTKPVRLQRSNVPQVAVGRLLCVCVCVCVCVCALNVYRNIDIGQEVCKKLMLLLYYWFSLRRFPKLD